MSEKNTFIWGVPFKEIPLQDNDDQHSISPKLLEEILVNNKYSSEHDAYSLILLKKLESLNKYEKKEFIEYQISYAQDKKQWFFDLQSLLEKAMVETIDIINPWPHTLKGIDEIMKKIYDKLDLITGKKRQTKPELTESFRLIDLQKNEFKIRLLRNQLIKHRFIAEDTGESNFIRIFSGKNISNPVVWTGKISELYYLIKLIYTQKKYVVDLKQKQWEVTCMCFVNDGEISFDRHKFKNQKRPSLTGDLLEKIVKVLE